MQLAPVVKEALKRNAVGVILCHNHVTDSPEPSKTEIRLTKTLKTALALVDVRVVDHYIFGRGSYVSFSDRGLLSK